MSAKIDLERGKSTPPTRNNHSELHLCKSLPFFIAKTGRLVHRVRRGRHHYFSGKYSHTSVIYWCGNNGFPMEKYNKHGGLLLAAPLDHHVLCIQCEKRARAAGKPTAQQLAGKEVQFQQNL